MTMATTVVDIFEAPDYPLEVHRAAELLRGGGVVVLPTETVYGAAGALTNPQGLARLKQLRAGAESKPFTIHVARRDDAAKYLDEINDYARRLMTKLWPGPVALMFEVPAERRAAVAKELDVAESDIYNGSTITLRFPDYIVTSDVILPAQLPILLTRPGGGQTPQAC